MHRNLGTAWKGISIGLSVVMTVQSALATAPAKAPVPVAAPAPAPAKLPDPIRQELSAALAISRAEQLDVNTLLGLKGGQAKSEGLTTFENELFRALEANAAIGLVDDIEGFKVWWDKNKAMLLLEREKMGPNVSLQTFLLNSYIKFKVVNLKANEHPGSFVQWITSVASSSIVRRASESTWIFIIGVFTFMTGVVYGAMVAGPIAGFVNAFLEPVVRPIREKAVLLGARLFERPAIALNSFMFDVNSRQEAKAALGQASTAIKEMKAMIEGMGPYGITPEQIARNEGWFQAAWNRAYQVMVKTLPPAYQAGRGVLSDALIFRPKIFADGIAVALSAYETSLQGAESMVDRVSRLSTAEPRIVYDAASAFREAISTGNEARIVELRAKFAEFGANAEQIARIEDGFRRSAVFRRHAITTTAAHALHEQQYREFNRALPTDLANATKAMRMSFGIDNFHREFAQEVKGLLNTVGIQLDAATKAIEAVEAKEVEGRHLRAIENVNAKGEENAKRAGELTRKKGTAAEERVRDVIRGATKK